MYKLIGLLPLFAGMVCLNLCANGRFSSYYTQLPEVEIAIRSLFLLKAMVLFYASIYLLVGIKK